MKSHASQHEDAATFVGAKFSRSAHVRHLGDRNRQSAPQRIPGHIDHARAAVFSQSRLGGVAFRGWTVVHRGPTFAAVAERAKRIVWVLGAGFSAPLGGPLLRGLLSPMSWHDLQAHYADTKLLGAAEAWAVCLYHYGRNYEEGALITQFVTVPMRYPARNAAQERRITTGDGEYLWSDAEAFIDQLDAETQHMSGDDWGRFQRAAHAIREGVFRLTSAGASGPVPPLKEVRDAARRLVGAECAMFVEKGDPDAEQWHAHVHWFSGLPREDTLVTFNYDLVLETMRAFLNGRGINTPWNFVLPGDAPPPGVALVLKLHGSIDWKREAPRRFTQGDKRFLLTAPGDQLAIATPGPGKHERTSEFLDVWQLAEKRIESADAIVFVGYRFPAKRRDRANAIARGHREQQKSGVVSALGFRPRPSRRPRREAT